MHTVSLALVLTLFGCNGVDGEVIRQDPSVGADAAPPDAYLFLSDPPPAAELQWWHHMGSTGADGPGAAAITANASVMVGQLGAEIDDNLRDYERGNFILGMFDRDAEIGVAADGQINASSFALNYHMYGEATSELLDIATAADDALWTAGSLTGRMDFGGADLDIGDAHAAVVVRYPSQLNGSAQVRTFTAAQARAVALAAAGPTVYAAISYEGSLATGLDDLVAEGSGDAALLALDTDGTTRWARRVGGPGRDVAHAVAALPDGAVIVGRTDAGLSPGGPAGGFVRRTNADGATLWQDVIPDTTLEAVAVHADGTITVAGNGSSGGMLAHYGVDGTRAWTSALTLRTDGVPVAIAIDGLDRIVIGGQTLGPAGTLTPGAFLEFFDRTGVSTRTRIYPGDGRFTDVVSDGPDVLVVGTYGALNLGLGPLPHVAATDSFFARLRVSAD